MQSVKNSSNTNTRSGSVTQVRSADYSSGWISPPDNEVFHISSEGVMPEIVFEVRTRALDACQWSWTLKWDAKASGLRERARKGEALRTFEMSGRYASSERKLTVDFGEEVVGGQLTVTLVLGEVTLNRTVTIQGKNPTAKEVSAFIETLEDMDGFDKVLEQETGCKHFIELDGEPIVAFDQGYGITQMTNPAPSYEQAWSWKANIRAGSAIYQDKVREAQAYLGKNERSYTPEQLQHEVLSRWNGGSYHQWDSTSQAWVRKKNLLCDSEASNIGWAMTLEKNKGKTEADLRARDKGTYRDGKKGQSAEHPWRYTGVCYADHVLGE